MNNNEASRSIDSWSFWDDLEIEALKITNNLEEDEANNASRSARRKWKPSGTITMYDDAPGVKKVVPVRGAKARAYSWFTTKEAITSSSGYFHINHNFKGYVNYSIKWERNDYEIRSKTFGQAYYNGPRLKRKAWNLEIRGGMSRMYAIIHRAAHRYYYEARAGIRTPPKRNQMLGRLTIAAYDWEKVEVNGNHNASRRWSTWPEIKIFKPSKECHDIYATTIHELAHASHWDLGKHNDFNNSMDIVKESWARGVQWAVTRLEYSGYVPVYARLNYTGVVHDMVDGVKNRSSRYWWDDDIDDWGSPSIFKSYTDRVSGYSMRQVEDAIIGQRNWNGWRDNIKNKYTNGTENNLDAAFIYWNAK